MPDTSCATPLSPPPPFSFPQVLRPYQKLGVDWLRDGLQAHRAVLLADDPGLGKTVQALTAARVLGSERVLVICPAGARRVWTQEISRWCPDWSGRVLLVEPGARLSTVQRKLFSKKPLVLVVGYDEFSDRKSYLAVEIARQRWDLLVLDEAHFLKNSSNRTQAIYGARGDGGVQSGADRIILLTGTPTPNHAGELYQHYRAFWPRSLGPGRTLTQIEFEEKFTVYRDTVFGRQVTGSRNQGVLRQALQNVVLRRRKSEVLPELPPLILQDVPLAWSDPLDPGYSWDTLCAQSDDELLASL